MSSKVHRQAIEFVISYAEREVFSRVLERRVILRGPQPVSSAASFTHFHEQG